MINLMPEFWTAYERLFLASMQNSDPKSPKQQAVMDRLTKRASILKFALDHGWKP
jgi:hypothetical protein